MSVRKLKRKSLLGIWDSRGRAFLGFFRRGSLIAEAALSLPLFFFCVITLIGMLEMYRTSMVHTVRLQQEAEELGAMAAAVPDAVEYIDLYESIPFSGGFPILKSFSSRVACRGRVHAWVGRSGSEGSGTDVSHGGQMVYVTEHRSVYHTDSRCTHLALQIQTVRSSEVPSLRNREGKRYHACEKCAAHHAAEGVSYITPEGNHFHYDENCSGLTRTVRMEKLEELGGLHICSRCAEREAG